jgi:hypothetical protein
MFFFVVESLLFGVLDFVEYRTWKKTSHTLSKDLKIMISS